MGITGSAVSVSQEIYIAFKHLLSLSQNLLHHNQSADHLLRNTSPPECIFCGKDSKRKIKKGSIWTTESLSKFEYGGGATILETAENRSDYIFCSEKLKGYDLFACEVQYHRSCHKEFIRKPTNLSMDFDLKSQQSDMEATHKDAFTEVCAIVDNKLIKEGGIIKL